jgi:hypothetical protein
MGYIGEDPADVAFVCAGINHMAFYLRIERDGVDLYPRLFEAMNRPEVYNTNPVRFELMKRLGYFVTESSEHNAEYSPFFIPRGPGVIARFNVPIDEYLRRCDNIVDEFERMKRLGRSDEPMEVHRSHEYGSTIIHSMVTGRHSVIYGNQPNEGAITSLPKSAIVEVATVVDRAGLRPTTVGELPPQLVAYMQPHVSQHELFIRAVLEGRRDHVYQAAMFDPLTAATLSLDQIVEMCDELIAAHGYEDQGGCLPRLDKTATRVPACGKQFDKVDPRHLRASWDAAQAKAAEDFLLSWHVVGPFRGAKEGQICLDLPTPVEEEFHRRGDGSVNLKSTYDGTGATLAWKKVTASKKNGMVNLTAELGPHEWSVAYGYTEIHSDHARRARLRCGSDDGIRIWLNGHMVHSHEARRSYKPHSDSLTVHLDAGVNRLLVKIDNAKYGWAFGVALTHENV